MQTLTQQELPQDAQRAHVTWASPSADLWVASSADSLSVRLLGFVEQSLDGFVAVGGGGASLGRHALLADAQRAVQSGVQDAASSMTPSWRALGAPVITPRELRSR